MEYLDDEESFAQGNRPARPSPITIVALLAAAGAAAMLLWMNLGLSNRVSNLEDEIATLKVSTSKKDNSKELTDIGNQLDSVTQALANHLKMRARSRNGQKTSTIQPVRPLPQTQPLARLAIPNNSSHSNTPNVLNSRLLPPPVSSAPAPQYQSSSGGGWVVNITSVSDPQSASEEVARLRGMGINAESIRAVSNGRVWYRIRVPGFATDSAARAQRGALEARLGIRDTWIGRR